jgi:hypothetical protein
VSDHRASLVEKNTISQEGNKGNIVKTKKYELRSVSKLKNFALISFAALMTGLLLSGCVSNTSEESANRPNPEVSQTEESNQQSSKSEGSFRISVMNFDETSFPKFEIWVKGKGSWFPDLSTDGDVISDIGPFFLGEIQENSLFIYPYGRDGIEFSIPFKLPLDHISNSDMGQLFVEIEDGHLKVLGEMIEGTEAKFSLR